MPSGSNVLNSTEPAPTLVRTAYAARLAERREVEQIRQLTNFGLALGWLFTLLGGFCWLCLISRLDWLWCGMFVAGVILLVFGAVLPQALDRPHRIWMGLAHLQGKVVMTVLLTIVYFTLIWPLGLWERKRRGTVHPFHTWDNAPPVVNSGWEALSPTESSPITISPQNSRRRSLLRMFLETLSFFAERGHYFLLPVLLLLLLLGLILFFVQSSVLAPFIYTIG